MNVCEKEELPCLLYLIQIFWEGGSESGEGSGSGKNNGSISGGSGKKKGGGQKVLDLLQSVWKSNDSKSKSSGNLHVL